MSRLAPAVVLLDAGGVIVLPRHELVAGALSQVGVRVPAHAVAPAHYAAVRALDRGDAGGTEPGYLPAFARALGLTGPRLEAAVTALGHLADRAASGEILWSEPAPGAIAALRALHRRGRPVFVVTNSDGHGEQNLRDAGICQVGPGRGVPVSGIVDSTCVGHAKPDPRIFAIALARAGAPASAAVHVGDMLATDVAGARAAGVAAIHLDPSRRCRRTEHRHVRSLAGLWRHVAA